MIKYTVKLIAWSHNPNDAGYFPIYIRITVNRKTGYIATGRYVSPKMWDEKNEQVKAGFPGAKDINPEITHKKSGILNYIVKMQVENKEFTAETIKAQFSGKERNNIFNFIDAFCVEVKHKIGDSTIAVYKNHSRKLEQFHGSRSLTFEEMNLSYLAKYERHLRDTGAGSNYIHALFKTLKTFFNAARKKKIITEYPFDQYENPIYRDPQKDYLTLDELKKWEAFCDETKNMVHKQSAVYFLLGCYSGLRISDWKAFDIKTHVEDNKVKLRARKNGEWVTVPLNGPLARNIERMRVLPLTIEEPTINEKLKIIAKACKINKKISSHNARKTFAVTMCADRGVSSETCAELLGITVNICVRHYYSVSDIKIRTEVLRAWDGL